MSHDRNENCERAEKLLPLNRSTGLMFSNEGWRGFVFDRDKHGAARLPRWFFEWLQNGTSLDQLSICGSGELFCTTHPDGLVSVAFQWSKYKELMRETYSASFTLFQRDMSWVIRMDPDLTTWGADEMLFQQFLMLFGGEGPALESQFGEFEMSPDEHGEFAQFLKLVFFGRERNPD